MDAELRRAVAVADNEGSPGEFQESQPMKNRGRGETACILRQFGKGEMSQCFDEVKGELRLKVKVKGKR
jgi:hypothetical protein